MNKSVLAIMGGAVIVAILVALIVQAKLSPGVGSGAVASTEILVASKKLLIGEKIKPEDVRWQAWPESAVFKGMIKRSEQVDEKDLSVYDTPLRRSIESGEPVTLQSVIADVKGGNNFLAASLEPGLRAVGVAVKANTSAGGFLSPGDHVDVVLSYTAKLKGDADKVAGNIVQRYATQTVLSNVRVMAVDQNSKEDEAAEIKVAKTVTLEVTKEGAEILALAESMGDISLALRRLGEKDTPADAATTMVTDATTSEVIRRINALMNKAKTTSNTVRLYSGVTIQNVPVRSMTQPAGGE